MAPGKVTAVVQGSRPTPYQVSIRFRPLAERLWTRLETLLAAQALFSARLLAGDVPPELEAVFAEAGAPLFPAGVDELTQRCDCPDFAVPCKHLAATFYLLAEAFDADPFQLLHWRGRDRARLLARLRELRGADAGTDSAAGEVERRDGPLAPPVGAGLALADLPAEPLAGMLDRFWVAPVPLPARAPTLATEPELVLRQLGPPGAAIGGRAWPSGSAAPTPGSARAPRTDRRRRFTGSAAPATSTGWRPPVPPGRSRRPASRRVRPGPARWPRVRRSTRVSAERGAVCSGRPAGRRTRDRLSGDGA
ncbi:hypothetical protein GCM10027615_75070 [Plantactinospora veratri]